MLWSRLCRISRVILGNGKKVGGVKKKEKNEKERLELKCG